MRICRGSAGALLLIASGAVSAEGGSWLLGSVDDGTPFASTFNADGEVLGLYCDVDSANCVWILGSNTPCEPQSAFAARATTSKADAQALTMHCGGKLANGLYRYVLSEFGTINDIVMESTRLHLVFPPRPEGVDFDLTGGKEAIDGIRSRLNMDPADKDEPAGKL